jgi:hypothetical protein
MRSGQRSKRRRRRWGQGAEEAARLAHAQVQQQIENSAQPPTVSALARIGDGGGVSDPLISVAEQQRDLQQKMLGTLKVIQTQDILDRSEANAGETY